MDKNLMTKVAIFILVLGLLVSTASAARLVVYVYDSSSKNPLSGAYVVASTGSVFKSGYTGSQGTYTFDIPKDRGTVYVGASKTGYRTNTWEGRFTTYVRLGLRR